MALPAPSSPSLQSRRPLWTQTQERVEEWRLLGASPFLCRAIKYGIYEPPTIPFVSGEVMGELPQSAEDLEFGIADLRAGCKEGIYEDISAEDANLIRAKGNMISSAFVVWQEGVEGRKGRFVVNLSKQSKHWKKGSVKMETLPQYAMDLNKGDHMVSFDIKSGYRHFRLAPGMRDWFCFRYDGRFFRCIALPFGWGRSPLWFTQLLAPVVRHMRTELRYRVLAYIDDFLVSPTRAGVVAKRSDCNKARSAIEKLLNRVGLTRHPTKGEWTGSTRVEHLGSVVDTILMKFYIAPRKIEKVRSLAAALLRQAVLGRRWVETARLKTFAGVCVSLSLAMPFARFYTRAIYWDLSRNKKSMGRASRENKRCRLSHQTLRDMRFWKRVTSKEKEGRPIRPTTPDMSLHTDAADLGFGGTLGPVGRPGDQGLWESQGVWSWKDRAASITYRELKAVRLLLMGNLGKKVQSVGATKLVLHCDNAAVVHITNAMVSASRPMMRELRRLKRLLDSMGVYIDSQWLPSVANRFADSLSRRFPRNDLRVRRQLRRSVMDGMRAPVDAFPYRPLGEHPVFMRRQVFAELGADWDREQTRLLCPPVDLIGAVVRKLRLTKAPAMLLIPNWPLQPWYQPAIDLAGAVTKLPAPPEETWEAKRTMNPAWRLLLLEVNLPHTPDSPRPTAAPQPAQQ
jgi:Reverse transcriptase (RNA-dependent DNA polymerase)